MNLNLENYFNIINSIQFYNPKQKIMITGNSLIVKYNYILDRDYCTIMLLLPTN